MWLGLCHPRSCRYERGGARRPLHVAVKAGVSDLLNRRPACGFLVVSVFTTVVLDNCV